MSEKQIEMDSLEILKKHGKSFNFARLFLAKDTGNSAARLYAFCRLIDDIVDEPKGTDAALSIQTIQEIRKAILEKDADHQLAGDFITLCEQQGIEAQYGLHLIEGVQSDTERVTIRNEAELIQYSYLVAGVVGLMMCPILHAPSKAKSFAVDLGIAMQLTNIARDVLEDAQNGRRYIPGNWINNLSAREIANPNIKQKKCVMDAIRRLLVLADKYYKSGVQGIEMLPKNNQLGITVAATVYREIGVVLNRENHFDYMKGRVFVSKKRKLSLALQTLLAHLFKRPHAQQTPHNDILHWAIKDWLNAG